MYSPYPIKLESVLEAFSDQELLKLLKIVSAENNGTYLTFTPSFLMRSLKLRRRNFNCRMEKLITLGLVDMINGKYAITQLGKDMHDALNLIEDAIKLQRTSDNVVMLKFANDIGTEFYSKVTERFF